MHKGNPNTARAPADPADDEYARKRELAEESSSTSSIAPKDLDASTQGPSPTVISRSINLCATLLLAHRLVSSPPSDKRAMPAPLCSVTSAATAHKRPSSRPERFRLSSRVKIPVTRSAATMSTRAASGGEFDASSGQCHRGSPTNVATLNEDWIQSLHPNSGFFLRSEEHTSEL